MGGPAQFRFEEVKICRISAKVMIRMGGSFKKTNQLVKCCVYNQNKGIISNFPERYMSKVFHYFLPYFSSLICLHFILSYWTWTPRRIFAFLWHKGEIPGLSFISSVILVAGIPDVTVFSLFWNCLISPCHRALFWNLLSEWQLRRITIVIRQKNNPPQAVWT